MIYGYIRVSTDKQTVENQRFEILEFAKKNNICVEKWIEETASGTLKPEQRELGELLRLVQKGDLIICSELSRLGRSLFMIMSILNKLMEKGIRVWTIKDNYRLGDDIQSKVLAFAFGLSAEIERNLISQRTKEALARKKMEGKTLGRPRGKCMNCSILDGAEINTTLMLMNGFSINKIATHFGVHRDTLKKFIRLRDLDSVRNFDKVRKMLS